MRVGITAAVYHPEMGGSGTYLRHLRDDLIAAGHDVKVVCFGESPSSVDVVRVSRRMPIPQRLTVYTTMIARTLYDADVWYVNDYGAPAALLRPFVRKPTALKVIGDWAWETAMNRRLTDLMAVLADGRDPLLEMQRSRQPPAIEFRKILRTASARVMDKVIVPSRYLANIVGAWGVPRAAIAVIPNGIEPEPRRTYDPPTPTVLAVGRLVPWKGFDHLIRAVARIASKALSARLLILGDGPERSALEALAASLGVRQRVEFRGQVGRPTVRAEMRRASLLALPSAYEGLPHVVLEAFAEGCPVVASGAGGTAEVVHDRETGLLVPYADVPALGEAVLELLGDRSLAERVRDGGYRSVESAFAWARTSRQTVELLETLAWR